MIIDAHRHVIAAGVTSAAAPQNWRPAVTRQDGRQVRGYRGRQISSAEGEFEGGAEQPGQLCPNKHFMTKAWYRQEALLASGNKSALAMESKNMDISDQLDLADMNVANAVP